jgi:DNA-binding NtrC family response regulator/ribosome-associated protein YbcJ (S4-like RNA binding protein)
MNARRPPPTPSNGSSALEERRREWAEDPETESASLEEAPRHEDARPQTFLIVRQSERVVFVDLTDPGEWVVGRTANADVVVDDRQVSRRHAKLRLSSGVLAIEDLGSRNGTIVNGRALVRETARIGTGDVIEVGTCQLVVATKAGRVAAGPASTENGQLVDVVVADPAMARLYEGVRKVARMPTTVLILGETGSGKDVLAQRLHAFSSRANNAFVRINCAGIPESLLESELFGHERGSFTGADRRKVGYFEAANGGTIFLDEIGELSESAQVKLLHVLENRTVTRLGGTTPIPIDVRVVCATHRDLQALVARERFRPDLYYRISPFMVRVPPLRQRQGEIELLATVFVKQLAAQIDSPSPTIAHDAVALLLGYAWPGNVRELRNAVEHAFVMAEGTTLRKEHFAPEIRGMASSAAVRSSPIRQRVAEVERRTIEEAIAAEGGNQTRAAARLGMPRRTLVHKLAKYRRGRGRDEDGGADG